MHTDRQREQREKRRDKRENRREKREDRRQKAEERKLKSKICKHVVVINVSLVRKCGGSYRNSGEGG